jgi:hypothetical protein
LPAVETMKTAKRSTPFLATNSAQVRSVLGGRRHLVSAGDSSPVEGERTADLDHANDAAGNPESDRPVGKVDELVLL